MVGNNLARFGIEFGLALFLASILIGSIALNMLNQGYTEIQNVATANNYTQTANKIPAVKDNINTGIWLLLLNFILAPLFELWAERKVRVSYVSKVFTFSIGLVFIAIFVFKLGIPRVISSGMLADGDVALMLDLISITVLVSGMGGLIYQLYGAIKRRTKKESGAGVIKLA